MVDSKVTRLTTAVAGCVQPEADGIPATGPSKAPAPAHRPFTTEDAEALFDRCAELIAGMRALAAHGPIRARAEDRR